MYHRWLHETCSVQGSMLDALCSVYVQEEKEGEEDMKDEYYVCVRSEKRFEASEIEAILEKELKDSKITVRLL